MRILFNDVEEFLDELRADGAAVKGKVVRITIRRRHSQSLPGFAAISVCAGYLPGWENMLVVLEVYTGDTMSGVPTDDDGLTKAGKLLAELTEKCKALGLSVRAGAFSE